jgi:hypothetical protein
MQTNLGALERPKDKRDFPLGAAAIPIPRPKTLNADISWMQRNYQAQLPFCGPHAKTHNKAIQDHVSGAVNHYTPRFTSVLMKDPSSPVYDHYAVDAGTDMRQLLSFGKTTGENLFDPLGNDTSLPIDQYVLTSVITPDMKTEAASHLISAYAFGNADYDSICDAVNQWKSAILLVKVDEGFWGTSTPTFTTPKWGHFITAYDWDDDKQGIWAVDSAEPDEQYARKFIARQYITPTFFYELGTTVDILPEVVNAIKQTQLQNIQKQISLISQIVQLLSQWIKGRSNTQ